ncbi:MAG TPA: hypothetical protein VNA24_35640 [Hyalangium sp.]|jgi:hypothetical protein|nr:hypothetical protein [Hyalangium sp.]
MRTLLSASAGFLGGVILAWGIAMVWNPNYEDALPLICGGAVAGPVLGILWARRRRPPRP